MLNDQQLLRYSRQILLPEIDITGQQKLREAHVLIIGMGGLGCPAALYLACAGIGTLTLADGDHIEVGNLPRQILFSDEHLDQLKATTAATVLKQHNPELRLHVINERLEHTKLKTHVANADIVVDASDNFATRYTINEACVLHAKPLVSAAAIRMQGQLSVFNKTPQSPCYACLYPPEHGIDSDDMRCANNGILGPIVGMLGAWQALEVIKIITHAGQCLDGRLLLLDGLTSHIKYLQLKKNPDCSVCGDHA